MTHFQKKSGTIKPTSLTTKEKFWLYFILIPEKINFLLGLEKERPKRPTIPENLENDQNENNKCSQIEGQEDVSKEIIQYNKNEKNNLLFGFAIQI